MGQAFLALFHTNTSISIMMLPMCCGGDAEDEDGEFDFDNKVEVVAYKPDKPAQELTVSGKQYQQNLGSHIRLPQTVVSLYTPATTTASLPTLKPVAGRLGTGFLRPDSGLPPLIDVFPDNGPLATQPLATQVGIPGKTGPLTPPAANTNGTTGQTGTPGK